VTARAAGWLPYAAVLGAALAARLAFIYGAPALGGDWDIYQRVALNMLRGCGVSLSDPAGEACVPHFGGNQLPGYPAFVALGFALAGPSEAALRVLQALLGTAAIGYLMLAVRRLTASDAMALAAGLVLALSPLAVAWPRFLVTEALALASTTWVLAELIRSLAERRLRVVPLALALAVAIFLRTDSVLLAAPVALAGFMVERPAETIRHGALLALLVALPLAAWTARNVAVGLPSLMPPPMTMPDGSRAPVGYLAWGRTWLADEYQRAGWGYPVNRFAYANIAIDAAAYDDAAERSRVEALLAALRRHGGRAFPVEIDDAFQALADERTARAPLRTWLWLPLRRAWWLWTNPFSSHGWPTELPASTTDAARLGMAAGGLRGVLALARAHPGIALGKALTAAYKYALVLSFIAAVVLAAGRRLGPARPVVWIAAAYVVARTAFFAWTATVETRYLVEAVPLMEVAVALAALALWRRAPAPLRRSASPPT
jgi:4-amino-4-deoxy-L-arabinose transferase-like glycosyltransferase